MQSSQQPLLSVPTSKKLKLLDLPEEILSTLSRWVWELCPPHPWPPVKSFKVGAASPAPPALKGLSRTCKKLRRIVIPDLFRLVHIGRLVVIYSAGDGTFVKKIDYQQLEQRCQFVSPYAKQLTLKISFYSKEVLTLSFQRILDLLPSLETVYNMPRDLLYKKELVACIAAHENLQCVEVSAQPMKGRVMDSHMPGDHLPCTSVYRYHLNLQHPYYDHTLETYFAEIYNPGIRVSSLSLSLTALDDIESLICRHQIFPDLFFLSLFNFQRDNNNPERITFLMSSFLNLNPTVKDLEFDSFVLFFEFAHLQSPPLARLSQDDYRHIKLYSSTWAISKWNVGVECQKLSVSTNRELEMKESRFFFDHIRIFIPTLKELAVDLYVDQDSAERLEDVLETILRIAKSMSSLRDLRRLDIHCLLPEEQLKSIALSVASENENLELICFGKGLQLDRMPPWRMTEARVKRGKGTNIIEIQMTP